MTDKTQTLPLAERAASIENALAERLTTAREQVATVQQNGVPGPYGAMIPKELPDHVFNILDETCTYAEAIFSVVHELIAETKDAKDRLDRVVGKLAAQNDVIEETHGMIAKLSELPGKDSDD